METNIYNEPLQISAFPSLTKKYTSIREHYKVQAPDQTGDTTT